MQFNKSSKVEFDMVRTDINIKWLANNANSTKYV